MKRQVFNPYLPLQEYVPDGEPRVFGERLYVYGSHDRAGDERYCMEDYVVWSAPVENLTDWHYEGISYCKGQDSSNPAGERTLQAPDVVQGADGRYYLYYCLTFVPEIGVAVSDFPSGPFSYYGHIKYPGHLKGGKELNEYLPFDPSVFIDEDGRIWLYYGFSPMLTMEKLDMGVEENEEMGISPGAMAAELEPDMLTLKAKPVMLIPGQALAKGTGFEGHAFFEASSMRKIKGKYYFVYSSELSHELCYAISNFPDKDFIFGGTVISNGDIGYQGNVKPKNMMGNNHGGMVEVNGEWYIFYHRQTHGTECSRQGCAERITVLPDGSIPQVEMTSYGLNDGPLAGEGVYPSAIACNIIAPGNKGKINYGELLREELPYIFEENKQLHYIANIKNDVVIGYKYFALQNVRELVLTVRGNANGTIGVFQEEDGNAVIGTVEISLSDHNRWKKITVPVSGAKEGALYTLRFIFPVRCS